VNVLLWQTASRVDMIATNTLRLFTNVRWADLLARLSSHPGICFGIDRMSELTIILTRIDAGESEAKALLLPLVYDELRALASAKLAHERPGQTLQATALVHEAWLRLVGHDAQEPEWDNRGHFFAAAAEAMRRILVDGARRKQRLKHGGDRQREFTELIEIAAPQPREDLLELDAALLRLADVDPEAVALVHLRYFAGLTQKDAARVLHMSTRSADRLWAYARAWLSEELRRPDA